MITATPTEHSSRREDSDEWDPFAARWAAMDAVLNHPVGSFVAEFLLATCATAPDAEAPCDDLYRAYARWCMRRDAPRLANVGFIQALADLGFDRRGGVWHGVALRR